MANALYIYRQPSDVPIGAYRRLPWSMPITWETGDPLAPVVLTGKTITLEFLTSQSEASALLTVASTIVDANAGRFTFSVSAAQWAAITPSQLVFRITVTEPGGDKYYLMRGSFSLMY